MKKRNKYLEMDGLVATTETHEWFLDKSSTKYAQKEDLKGISLKNHVVYVVRDLKTGNYERVIVDNKKGEPVYASNSLEEIGAHIDKLKLLKQYK